MAFTFHHTLASRAAVSVVISLWYHEDIDSLKSLNGCVGNDGGVKVSRFDQSRFKVDSAKRLRRLALHEKVKKSVSELLVPDRIKRYLLEFVQVIGENLEDWIDDHYAEPHNIADAYGHHIFDVSFFDISDLMRRRMWLRSVKSSVNAAIDVDLRKVLRWNPDGEIDSGQTGQALVRNENDSIKRFRLACAYCREVEMLKLWPSVQTHFSSPDAWDCNAFYQVSALFWWRYFFSFWPKSTSAYLSSLIASRSRTGPSVSMAELVCSCSYSFSNRCSPVTPYLLSKIRLVHVQGKDIIGLETDYTKKRFGVIFFRLPASYQAQILRDFPKSALKQLLLWRHQSFFIDAVQRSWNVFDKGLFDSILFHIAEGVERYGDSDAYRDVFLWYWTRSPARLRVVERIFYYRAVDDRGTTLRHFVGLLFGHSRAAEDRMKRVLFEGRHVLEMATRARAWDVLSDLVRTCLPEEEWEDKQKLLDDHFGVSRPPTPARGGSPWCAIS